MKFTLNLDFSQKWNVEKKLGLNILDEARKELGVHFSPELLQGLESYAESSFFYENGSWRAKSVYNKESAAALYFCKMKIEVTEEQARSLGLFANNTTAYLMAEKEIVSKCISTRFLVERSPKNDAILSVKYGIFFDVDAYISMHINSLEEN